MLSTCYVLSTILSAFFVLAHVSLTKILGRRYDYYSHFKDEGTEAQRSHLVKATDLERVVPIIYLLLHPHPFPLLCSKLDSVASLDN